jgi:hypothetical protein
MLITTRMATYDGTPKSRPALTSSDTSGAAHSHTIDAADPGHVMGGLPLHAYAGFVPGPSSSLGQDSGEPPWTPAPLTVADRIEVAREEVLSAMAGVNAAEQMELVNRLTEALTSLVAAASLSA